MLSLGMALRWHVRAIAAKNGIQNAHQLATSLRLTIPVAYRLWAEQEVERIDAKTLERLARFFRVSFAELLRS